MTQRITLAGREYEITGPAIEQYSPSSRRVFIEAIEIEKPAPKESERLWETFHKMCGDSMKDSRFRVLAAAIKAEVKEEMCMSDEMRAFFIKMFEERK